MQQWLDAKNLTAGKAHGYPREDLLTPLALNVSGSTWFVVKQIPIVVVPSLKRSAASTEPD